LVADHTPDEDRLRVVPHADARNIGAILGELQHVPYVDYCLGVQSSSQYEQLHDVPHRLSVRAQDGRLLQVPLDR
jgi:hypothetical protein